MLGGYLIRHLTIPVKGNEIHIYPICDVQVGGVGVDLKGFQEYVDEAMADPLARFVGVGDYTDGVSPSNRRLLQAAFKTGGLYDTPQKMMAEAATTQVNEFLDIVKPTAGRWDFLLEGHHFWEYETLSASENRRFRTTDDDIATRMFCPNLGRGSAMISYKFRGSEVPLRMYVRHGEGSGQSFAAPLNQLERQMRAFNAHIYLIGHHHKLVAGAAVKLDEAPEAETQLAATDARLVAAGSWLRGFVPNETSYAEAGMMVPLATGAPIIAATRRKNGTYRIRVTL